MAITVADEVQYPVVASVSIAVGDIAGGSTYAIANVPVGATVVGGELIVDTAWDATATSINIGDGGSATRYGSAENLQALGRTALDLTGFEYTETDTIDIAVTQTGTPSTGAARINVMYIVDARGHEVMG